MVLAGFAASIRAEERPAVGVWTFDGTLADRSGRGNDAYQPAAVFVAGHSGQGLQCGHGPANVPDSPELRPAPGFRVECWVKFDRFGPSWQQVLMKERSYQLRVDSRQEGGRFAFFLDLGGWEPRVSSQRPVQVGVWYHVAAGWDGKEIWLEVDGQRSTQRRAGQPFPSSEPLQLGQFEGVLDEVRIENPAARPAGVANWPFDGDLRDVTEHAHHLSGSGIAFAPGRDGQAVKLSRSLQVASQPDLQLAPGIRIDCSIYFDQLPADGCQLVVKNNEYQLRLNSAKEGSYLAFFTYLDTWEPRVTSEQRVEAGKWYRVIATWDGFTITLEVNGQRSHTLRSGLAKGTDNPLLVTGRGVRIDNLRIENPRRPTLIVRAPRQEHAILLAGRAEPLSTKILNVGSPSDKVTVQFKLPKGVRCTGPTTYDLGPLPNGGEKTIAWGVEADAPTIGAAEIHVTPVGSLPLVVRHPLVFFPGEDRLPASASAHLGATASDPEATTYYVDSIAGDNARAGTSPDAAWKDFTNVNGRVLGPGQRLLLRRGSVFNQELCVSAHGAQDRWAEIGTYGNGARPIIRRNWDIDDRCALLRNPDYLRIHGLTVCYAGKGLIITYSENGHRGLVVEDCIAHHIEGMYRFNAHGIPEWFNRGGAGSGDGMTHSSGIAIDGGRASDLVLRRCETFQCSSGYYMRGTDALIERVNCHDNFAHNTSPHPFIVDVHRAIVEHCIFDASGWHASCGTMGVMLGGNQGLVIRNSYFVNQPDSGSHDEGGIDFENSGNSCLIDRCTFQNNAGAAIEMLGLKSPQTTNVEIRNSRFIHNSVAKKLGLAEIYIWGQVRDPSICCSTGLIAGNGYVTLPGIGFYTNEAPKLTSWTLENNTQYATIEDIDRGMPFNRPPVVDAGPDVRTDQRSVSLAGQVRDDGRPDGKPPVLVWELLEGPGQVAFADPHSSTTKATFERPGDYVLRLVADDGEYWTCGRVTVHILPPGASVAKAWEFNHNLDKEGWTEVNPGTRVEDFHDQAWPTTAHPVKMVAGGYYILAIKDSPDVHLLSADKLDLDLADKKTLTIRFQNHTPATQMRWRFTTDADPTWDDAKSCTFPVVANDNENRIYTLDLAAAPGWKGRLRQLRLDLADGRPLTGTCRFDYIWLGTAARQP